MRGVLKNSISHYNYPIFSKNVNKILIHHGENLIFIFPSAVILRLAIDMIVRDTDRNKIAALIAATSTSQGNYPSNKLFIILLIFLQLAILVQSNLRSSKKAETYATLP